MPHLVRIGADGSQKFDRLLVSVGFTVAPLGPQTHSMVIFLVSEYIIGIDIMIVGTSPTLVPWHVALQLSCFSHIQFFATLWTVASQALLSMGFSRQEHWSGFPCPPPGDRPNLGIEPMSPVSPAVQVNSLPTELPGKPLLGMCNQSYL